MKRFILVLLAFVLFSCTNEDSSRRTLEGAGYTNIELHGYSWTGCGDDSQCTKFTATGPTGKNVEGVVGCGFSGCSKACTIRIR